MKSTNSMHRDCQLGILISSLILFIFTSFMYLCMISDANKVYNKENIRAKVLVFEESIHEYFLENIGIYTPYNKPEEKTAPEPAVYKPKYTNGRDLKAVPSKPMVFRQVIMSIAHYHTKGDSYWWSTKTPDYTNPKDVTIKFVIDGFNKLLFEYDHPVIEKINLYGVEIKVCNKREIESINWTKERINYYITEYRSRMVNMKYDYSCGYGTCYDDMNYVANQTKRNCKHLLESMNNNLTYKLSDDEIDYMSYRAR